jgi:uncharacterized protein (DUF2141 family)
MRKGIYGAATAATVAALGMFLTAGAAAAGDLTVTVKGAKPGGGLLMVGLYDSQAAFDSGRRSAGQQLPAVNDQAQATFADLPPGRYMAAVFQDADGDEKLSVNLFGVPVEAYGFAGDPPVTLGPPSFDAAAVTLGDAPVRLTATLTP